jgi:hypothetical protein
VYLFILVELEFEQKGLYLEVFFHLSHALALLGFNYFSDKVTLFVLGQPWTVILLPMLSA